MRISNLNEYICKYKFSRGINIEQKNFLLNYIIPNDILRGKEDLQSSVRYSLVQLIITIVDIVRRKNAVVVLIDISPATISVDNLGPNINSLSSEGLKYIISNNFSKNNGGYSISDLVKKTLLEFNVVRKYDYVTTILVDSNFNVLVLE